jgi:hypothetical protein
LSNERPKLRFMHNLTNDSSSLFPTEGILAEAAHRAAEAPEDKKAEKIAREFVKWCCGFGADFRNSPDRTNFSFWSAKTKLKLKDSEHQEVLSEAQRLFAKKIEQITRKADATLPQMNTMSE